MAIESRAAFAEECVLEGLFLGVNSHYLIATAQLRSGIQDDTNGDQIGPYRVTQQIWDANGSAADLEVILEPSQINDWARQCLFAALTAYRAQNRLVEKLGRFPSAVELYREQWSDASDDLPGKLQTALDATAELVEPAIEEALGDDAMGSPTIDDANEPPVPNSDPTKPTHETGEGIFLVKAPRIMEKLINDFGLTKNQAAGILGNIGLECDGFRLMQEVKPIGGGRGGFGWCQWTGIRRNQFEEFCSTQGLAPTSDAANYGFLKRELQTTQKASLDALKTTMSLRQAVRVFEAKFERAKAGFEHFDRRDRWGELALESFEPQLPSDVIKILDPDLIYQVVATAKDGTTTFWVIDQFTDDGGQVLIRQQLGKRPEILANDATIFPLKAGLVPDAVATALSKSFKPSGDPHPPIPSPSPGDELIARIFAKAKECDETLVTRNVPNTNHGRLACAWAVNEIVRRALGKPIGGGLSTANMGQVLRTNHSEVPENKLAPGMIVISPTNGGNVGHVGIVGAIKAPLSATLIYSNSSSRGVFSHALTVEKWKSFYNARKGLPVRFYALKR